MANAVSIFEVLGGPLAISTDEGQALHDRIAPLLRAGQCVALSFSRMETVTPTFLNAAIGQLYGEFVEEELRSLFSVSEAGVDEIELIKRVVQNAKNYFAVRAAHAGRDRHSPECFDEDEPE